VKQVFYGGKLRLPDNSREANLTVMAVCSIGVVIYLYLGLANGIFWDLSVYQRAVDDLRAGHDPYRTGAGLPFVYHPLVLDAFRLLNQFVALRPALLVLYAISFGWFVFELAVWLDTAGRTAARAHGVSAPTGLSSGISSFLAAAAFGGVGITSFLTGNITSFMHFALLAAFLRANRKPGRMSRVVPGALLLLFSIIKPYFLLYLLIPVVLASGKRAALVRLACMGAVFGGVWLVLAHLEPMEYAAFIGALKYQSLQRLDIGYSFFWVFRRVLNNDWLALGMHVAASAVLLLLAGLFIRRSDEEKRDGAALFLLYMVLTLANPRMKEYDLFPALVCFFIFLRTVLPGAGFIISVGLFFSSIPLLLRLVRTAGVVLPSITGASDTWQIVGLAALTLTLAATTARLRRE
jgi:hypothetical protein